MKFRPIKKSIEAFHYFKTDDPFVLTGNCFDINNMNMQEWVKKVNDEKDNFFEYFDYEDVTKNCYLKLPHEKLLLPDDCWVIHDGIVFSICMPKTFKLIYEKVTSDK